jgi:hypothetical protein
MSKMQASAAAPVDARKENCEMARKVTAKKLTKKARDTMRSKYPPRCARKYERLWSWSNLRRTIAERRRLRLATASSVIANVMRRKIRAVEKALAASMFCLAKRAAKPK